VFFHENPQSSRVESLNESKALSAHFGEINPDLLRKHQSPFANPIPSALEQQQLLGTMTG